ncbi:hypothetical protein MGH68_13935 [Erysipelothrix sp. D19-032]
MEDLLQEILDELRQINSRLSSIDSSIDTISGDTYNFMNNTELSSIGTDVSRILREIK